MDFRELLDEGIKQKIKKFLDALGWSGEPWTVDEIKTQITNLDDKTLLIWFNDKSLKIPHTPAKLQQDLVAREVKKRKL